MKKKILSILLITAMAFSFAACGGAATKYDSSAGDMGGGYSEQAMPSAPSDSMSMDNGFAADMDMMDGMDSKGDSYSEDSFQEPVSAPDEGGINPEEYGQKLVYTYNYEIQTKDFDASLESLKALVKKFQGYVESSELYGRGSNRTSYQTIRIPEKYRLDFLDATGEIGEVRYQSENTQDITLSYYDLAARLETLHTQHDRLMELLERADSLADIIELENALQNVEYEINSYTTQMRIYDNQVDYTTVHMTIDEVSQITPVEDDTFFSRIKSGLSYNLQDVADGIVDFIVFIITGIPYFIVLAVVIAVIVLIWRKIFRRRSAKKSHFKLFHRKKAEVQEAEMNDNNEKN